MSDLIAERIESAEAWMLRQPQADCPVRHIFGPGIYIRELTMPADTYAIGHYQKTEHMNVMLKGRVTVLNADGTHTTLTAPLTFLGKPGRKVGYVHEEVVWQNIYATTETDVETLEAMFLDKSATFEAAVPLLTSQPDGDYEAMLAELSVTAETVRAQSESEADQIPFPAGEYKCKVGRSAIDGRGIIATADIDVAEFIAPALLAGKRTPAGRFTNHAKVPNARMVDAPNGDVYLVSLRPIRGCRGGQDGEEITIDYRKAVEIKLRLLA